MHSRPYTLFKSVLISIWVANFESIPPKRRFHMDVFVKRWVVQPLVDMCRSQNASELIFGLCSSVVWIVHGGVEGCVDVRGRG